MSKKNISILNEAKEEKIKNEFPEGTLNAPYIPDTLPSYVNAKIRRMMIEHYVKQDFCNNKMDLLENKIKTYCNEKNAKVKNVTFNKELTGTEGRIMVMMVYLSGTTYYKHFKQSHLDQYILELKQLQDNTKI